MTRKQRREFKARHELIHSTMSWVAFHNGAKVRDDDRDAQAEQEREQQMVLAFVTEGLGE